MDNPLKRHMDAMEKLFGAEISGRLPFQSKAKVMTELVELGYAEEVERVFGNDQFRVKVAGYVLTPLGHLTYCTWA